MLRFDTGLERNSTGNLQQVRSRSVEVRQGKEMFDENRNSRVTVLREMAAETPFPDLLGIQAKVAGVLTILDQVLPDFDVILARKCV